MREQCPPPSTCLSTVGTQVACFMVPSWYVNYRLLQLLTYPVTQESGSPFRIPDVLDQQVYFDDLVDATNCTNAADRFECLRGAPLDVLQVAINASPSTFSYQSLRFAWVPVIDGVLITANPMQLVENGAYAKVSWSAQFYYIRTITSHSYPS